MRRRANRATLRGMKMVLVPIDFSDATQRVIDAAAALAEAIEGYVVLLHVAKAPALLTGFPLEQANVVEIAADIELTADAQLAEYKNQLLARGLRVVSLRLTGEAKSDIIDQARKLRADYVVMGSHGHSAFYDLVVGSTISAVLKKPAAYW